jgi:hypothetical protein
MLIKTAAFVVVIAGIMSAKSIIIPFLPAAFLAIIYGPPLYWMRTKGVPRFVSIRLIDLANNEKTRHIARLLGSNAEAAAALATASADTNPNEKIS